MSGRETLVLVDGSSVAFRSFYALFNSGLRTAQGKPTWAVYGFFNSLFDLIEKYTPNALAVCFDLAGPTFRHSDYEDYKAHRQEMPDDLRVQWPVIKEGIEILGVPIFEMEGFEADDLIGTIAKAAERHGTKVQILTGDHDAFQLLDDSIQVLMPGKKGLELYGRSQVYEKLGVWPEQIIDYKGLCGDASDNIPGVRGIGKVTAAKLLSSYGTIQEIYEHLEDIKQPALKQKLVEGRDSAFASKSLATIRLDVPCDLSFDRFRLRTPAVDKVADFFSSLEFKTMVNRLPKILSKFGDSTKDLDEMEGLKASVRIGNNVEENLGCQVLSRLSGIRSGAQASNTALLETSLKLGEILNPEVVTTYEQLRSLATELTQSPVIAFYVDANGADFHNSEIAGYALAWDPSAAWDRANFSFVKNLPLEPKTAYVPVRQSGLALSQCLDPQKAMETLGAVLEDASIDKIVHNSKLAANFLSLYGVELSPVVFDPMLASFLVNADEKHGLSDQSERLLNYSTIRSSEPSTPFKRQAVRMADTAERRALKAADDARITLELAGFYSRRLDEDQRYLLGEMDLPLSMVLARMEQAGVALDLPYLEQFSKELTSELARLEKEIYEIANHPFNINSTQQLQKVLYEELGLKTKSKTKTGYSTDASALEALRSEHTIISKILEYRQLSKLRSTYVDALPKQVSKMDGRLHGEFNQTVAATGRLSSSNPNLQNIPIRSEIGRRIRRAFIPGDQASVLISADYSQIELRLLAHMSGDETLIDAFKKNQDIHARTAMEIFDVPLNEVTPEMRAVGKTMNFALIYQQGAYATAQSLSISTKEAQTFIEKYFNRLPKVRGFMSRTINEARACGFVSTLWGRKRYFRHLNDSNDGVRKADERAACNAPLQGSAADLMKLAMVRLDRQLQTRTLKARIILQVHDELVLEVPENEVDETKEIVIKSMELDQPLRVPLKVDFGVGKNWMEAK